MSISTGSELELLLLALLRQPAHGYALVEAMKERSGGTIDVPEGSVYPALYRLEGSGLIESSEVDVKNRRRRVYRLTPGGRAELAARVRTWQGEVKSIEAILQGA
jgi:PadR family transcriptional regulator PadR